VQDASPRRLRSDPLHTDIGSGAAFQLCLIPIGAFTEITTKLAVQVDPEDPHAYPNRPAWQRLLMVVAGPAANYLLAGCSRWALPVPWHRSRHWYGVGKVMHGYDAYGKLQPDDRILEVDHVPLFYDSGATLTDRSWRPRAQP